MNASSSPTPPKTADPPMRLYCLRYGKFGPKVRDSRGFVVYFDDKESAKRQRDELNTGLTQPIFVVSHGPDHVPRSNRSERM
jgi:hypothetical protein